MRTEHGSKSVSAEETFARDVDEREALEEELERLAARVARGLAAEGLVGRTVVLKLRYADFTTITRSASREAATASAEAIATAAHDLLAQHWTDGAPVRLVGVGMGNLRPVHAPGQLPLPWPAEQADAGPEEGGGAG